MDPKNSSLVSEQRIKMYSSIRNNMNQHKVCVKNLEDHSDNYMIRY